MDCFHWLRWKQGLNIIDLRIQDAQMIEAYITGSCENFITLSPSCPFLNTPITLTVFLAK